MRTRTTLAVATGLLVVATVVAVVAICGGGDDLVTPSGPPEPFGSSSAPSGSTPEPSGLTIVTVYEDVNWYPSCATYPIELGGKQFYPLPMGAPAVDESKYPIEVSVAIGAFWGPGESLPRVAPPGPGDDIGRVIEYSDGMARFDSESGNVAWLTLEVQEYWYVC